MGRPTAIAAAVAAAALLVAAPARGDVPVFGASSVAPASPLFPGLTAEFTTRVTFPADPSQRYRSKRVVEFIESGLVLEPRQIVVDGQPVPCGTTTATTIVQCGVRVVDRTGTPRIANTLEDLTNATRTIVIASRFKVTATPLGARTHSYESTCVNDLGPTFCSGPGFTDFPYEVKAFNLLLAKSGPPGNTPVGQPFDFTVTVTNQEAVEAFGVTITDALPPELEPVAVIAPLGGTSCGPGAGVTALGADGEVRIVAQPAWSVSVRPPGSGGRGPPGFLAAAGAAGASFSFVVRVRTRYGVDPTKTPTVSNVARARAAVPDGAEVTSAPAVVRLGAAAGGSLSLTKEAFGPDSAHPKEVKAGDKATFRLTLSRDGTVAGPFTLLDPVPTGSRVTAIVVAGTRRPCPVETTTGPLQVSCGPPTALPAVPVRVVLPAGQTLEGAGSTVIVLEAEVLPSAAPGPLTNVATVTDALGVARQAQDSLTVGATGTAGVNLSFRAERAVATKGEVVPFTATLGFYQAWDPAAGALQLGVPLNRDLVAIAGTAWARIEGGATLSGVTMRVQDGSAVLELPRQALPAGTVLRVGFRTRVALRAAAKEHHVRADLAAAGSPPRALASARATVRVYLDPDLDLCTVLGDVFRDDNANGRRDPGEPGVPGALVVMEDGLQAFTDDDGRYHLAAVRPGQRVIKLAGHMLPPGALVTTDQTRVLTLTRGLMMKVDFGVRVPRVLPTILPPAPAATEAAALKVRPAGGYTYLLTGAVPRGARVRVGGGVMLAGAWATARVDAAGRYVVEVPIVPGRNRLALLVTAPDGVVTVYARDVFLVARAGGDLVVPRPADARLALRFPPGAHPGQDLLLEGSVPGPRPTLLRVSGVDILPDVTGRFGVRIRLPRDAAAAGVPAEAAFRDGFRVRFVHDLTVGGDFLLLVGIAEGQLGYVTSTKKASGKDGFFASGRIALYLKGQIRGRYLIEAAADLDDSIRSVGDVFKGDPRSIFRSLDPDRYYPVYGDASATVAGAERRGRLYVAVRLGASEVVLGNFMTGLTDVEYGRYARALSGGRAEIVVASRQRGAPPRTRVVVFGAWLQTARAHDEVRATGGSLYFLRHKEVVEGSEQVRVEVRDQVSNLPVSSTPLRAGVDYEVDYLGGRVTTRAPVATVAAAAAVVRSSTTAGNVAWVVVDYEYVVVDPANDGSLGARVQQRLGPVRVGGRLVNEFRAGTDYTLAGVDVDLSLGRYGRLLFEYAYSNGRLDGFGVSLDGGLSYRDRATPQVDPGRIYSVYGNAFRAEGDLRLGRGTWGLEARPYFRLVQRGFTDTAHVDERDLLQYGGEVVGRGPFGLRLVGRYDERHYSGADVAADAWRRDGQAEVRGALGRFGLALAFRLEEARDAYEDGGRTAVAAKGDVTLTPRLKLYALYQQNVEHHGTGLVAEDNTMGVVGAEVKLVKRYLTARAEGGYGAQGPLGSVGLQSDLGPGRVLYGTYTFSVDGDDRLLGTFATGGRQKADGTRAELFAEDQLRRDPYGRLHSQVAGVQLPLWKVLTLTAAYEHGKLDDGATLTERDAGSAGVGYAGGRVRAQVKAEVRRDLVSALGTPDGAAADPAGTTGVGEAAVPTSPPGERLQLLGAGALTVRAHRDLWLRGRLAYMRTIAHDGAPERKPEVEGTVGFAWRPTRWDGVAVLGRYSYLVDHPAGIDDPLVPVYRQRSHVASVAFQVRIWRWLSLGEKVGYKGLREWDTDPAADPNAPSEQHYLLWINRLMWHMTRKWDAAVEYRLLFTKPKLAAEDDQGVLIEVNRVIKGHLRIGAGWNFSQVPTDERAMGRYREHGFFVRAQGFL